MSSSFSSYLPSSSSPSYSRSWFRTQSAHKNSAPAIQVSEEVGEIAFLALAIISSIAAEMEAFLSANPRPTAIQP